MVDIKELQIGDRVRIVSEFTPECHAYAGMLKMRGKEGVVECIAPDKRYVKLEGNMWGWYPAAIECIVDAEPDELYSFDEHANILSLLG